MAKQGVLTTSDYLPIAEYDKLVRCLHRDRLYLWELYCRLSFCMALRVSDVCRLRWSDVLRDYECVVEEGKTKKIRLIKFNESVSKKIRQLYDLLGNPEPSQIIFLNPRTGRALTRQYINQKLKSFRVIYKIIIPRFSTHTFRKTFGRFVYESMERTSEALILLNRIFRHSSVEITMVYIGLRQAEINDVYDRIKF